MPAEVGIEEKERLMGNREQGRGQTERRVRLGEILTREPETSHPSDQNRHIGTQPAWG